MFEFALTNDSPWNLPVSDRLAASVDIPTMAWYLVKP